MNKIFIIYGLGNHFKKKIYPALRKFSNVSIGDIKTTKSKKIKNRYLDKLNKNILPNFAYIATPISTHYKYLKELANNNTVKYIFCEKTLTENYSSTKKIIDLYKSKNKFLVETYMYVYHPKFLYLKKFIKINKMKNTKGVVFCRYTIPKLNKSDHRNNALLTGGELYEIGCYPISLLYFLFNYDDKIIKQNILKKIVHFKQGVLVKIKLQNITFIISWGYNFNYRNKFIFYSKRYRIITEKIFGKKTDEYVKLKIFNSINKQIHNKKYTNNDNFYHMFKYCFGKLKLEKNKKDFLKESLIVSKMIKYFKNLI